MSDAAALAAAIGGPTVGLAWSSSPTQAVARSVDSFGSPAVLKALTAFEQNMREFFAAAEAARAGQEQGTPIELEAIEAKGTEVREALELLGEAVRRELTSP